MTLDLAQHSHEIEALRLQVPETALTQLALRLGRDRACGKVWDASLSYGVPLDALAEAVDYWCDDFDFRAVEAQLNELPLFAGSFRGQKLCFAHLRSKEAGAIPLLLLHGGSASLAELQALIGPLTEPARYGGRPSDACHVVCAALPGFGLSSVNAESDLSSMAAACAELMSELGYRRYVAHGSQVGGGVIRQLAFSDEARLAGAHLSSCPAFPSPDPVFLSALTPSEKSQLALLTQLQAASAFRSPDSPIEELALALTQLLDSLEAPAWGSIRDQLLAGITLGTLGGDARLRRRLRWQSTRESPRSNTPLAVCSFPLDAPCLRRFAERRHRIVTWTDQEHGGALAALEQPALLLASLLQFLTLFR